MTSEAAPAPPERMPLDQAARDLITSTGLDRSLFVEAGAGSGKTSQLVARITSLVLDHDVSLANIAAITFTEAAAAELQSRIRVAFEQRATNPEQPTDVERCATAIADADRAAISTLHGFASRILSEFAIAARLPPRVHVLDEVASQLAFEDRWSRFVDALYENSDHVDLLVRAALLGIPFEPVFLDEATVKDIASELTQSWDRLRDVASVSTDPVATIDFSTFDETVAALRDIVSYCDGHDDLRYVHMTTNALPKVEPLLTLGHDRKLRAVASLAKLTIGRGGRQGAWRCDLAEVKERLEAINDAVAEIRAAASEDVFNRLLPLVAQEVLAAADARRAAGGLEYHDLLVIAAETLREHAAVRHALRERFRYVLLDEFQDTDPIQIQLATLIATSIDHPSNAAWNDLPVDAGRLFFVGDPKQSIYRFRRADISLFLRAQRTFGVGNDLVRLTTNFRTVEPILTWANSLFVALLGSGVDEADADSENTAVSDQQPRYEALDAWRTAPDGADHRPVLLGGPHPDPKVRAGELRHAEAASVADAICAIAADPATWPVFDERSGEWRDARLGDITILLPTRTSLPYLRRALEDTNIPYRLATGTLVYDTQEVRDALAALAAIDDPSDTLSLVAALRSPLYACSDVDLTTYRSSGGEWDLRRDPPDSVAENHPVRMGLAHLRALWLDRWWLTPAQMLDRLLTERHAFLVALGEPRPAEVWRRLRFVVDHARAFETSSGGNLRDYVEWAALQSADRARVHEPLLPETDNDAVQILTIHGAKGLEFPITILSGMTTAPGNQRKVPKVLWDDDGRPAVQLRKGVGTRNHEPRADLEQEMDANEKLRLLYVAATRARDHLLVSCHHKATDKPTYAQRVWQHFAERQNACRPFIASTGIAIKGDEAVDDQPTAIDTPDRNSWIADRAALLEANATAVAVSATAIAAAADGATGADHGAGEDGEDEQGLVIPLRRRGRAGTAIGRAVHATLQVIDLIAPGEVNAAAKRQCDLEAIPEHIDTVVSLIQSALASDAVALARTHTHHREIYVAAPIGTRMIEGYVDLLIEGADGLIVVDYKTDTVASEAAIAAKLATYELQAAAYAVALEATTGLSVVECRFVFCKANGAIERTVRDLTAAKHRVVTHLAAGDD